MSKLGRNDPCHCGSGKKYKHCCLEKDEAKREEIIIRSSADDINMGPLDGGKWGLAKRGYLNWAKIAGRVFRRK
jgi:hypothetical protein